MNPNPQLGHSNKGFEPGFIPPELIKKVEAVFPESMRNIKITQPIFIYEMTVDKKGNIKKLKLIRGAHEGYPYNVIDRCFREALSQWRYHPAKKNGMAVDCTLVITACVEVR